MSDNILGTIRASAWPALFDCALRHYYHQIAGLYIPQRPPAAIGTAIHAGTAHFDSARLHSRPVSIGEAVDVTRETLVRPDEETVWDDGYNRSEADKIASLLTIRYCEQIAPTREYVAVEMKCEALDIQTQHGVIRVTGTTDRARVTSDGKLGISDIKSGATATERTEDGGRRASFAAHHLQLGIYELMAEAATGRPFEGPAEIIGLQTTKEAPVGVAEMENARLPLVGDADTPGLIEMAAGMLKTGIFPPNPRSMLCSKRYCAGFGRCAYRSRSE